ncbi:MAG: ATP-binding cassette domain-containing protein [Ginsengibacter sp.]
MQQPSVIVKELGVKMQGNTVLNKVSFILKPGQHLAILGCSGSGKSSLVNALAHKIHFSGSISFNFPSSVLSEVELVEQRYSFKNLSGITDFYYQQRFNSFDANDAPTISEVLLKKLQTNTKELAVGHSIENILKVLGILHLKDSPLIQLSSGEHKRFQLAKALLNPPALLILDSPYTGLDVAVREALNKILSSLARKGTQIILIPGIFPIPDLITHIALLEKQEISFFGQKEELKTNGLALDKDATIIYDDDLLPASNENFQSGTVVEMKDIQIKYGSHTILQNVSWKIKQGEKWLLKGRNGAGKSSLLNMITGDHPQAYSNELCLFGKKRGSGESIWDIKKNIGYISPELHAYFDKNITCYQAIGSGYLDTIGLYRKLSESQNEKILEWLSYLQIADAKNKPLHAIAVSTQRMILLIRALIKNPPLLILDEPCQGLDYQQSIQFVSLIDHICSLSKKTLIYVSHEESTIPSCIQKVLELERGTFKIYSINKTAALAVA